MRDDRVYLQHIRDALDDVAAYLRQRHDAFIDDRMRQDATLRKLEVIGQAVKNLSEQPSAIRLDIRRGGGPSPIRQSLGRILTSCRRT